MEIQILHTVYTELYYNILIRQIFPRLWNCVGKLDVVGSCKVRKLIDINVNGC